MCSVVRMQFSIDRAMVGSVSQFTISSLEDPSGCRAGKRDKDLESRNEVEIRFEDP